MTLVTVICHFFRQTLGLSVKQDGKLMSWNVLNQRSLFEQWEYGV
jgi:hypothetical protein